MRRQATEVPSEHSFFANFLSYIYQNEVSSHFSVANVFTTTTIPSKNGWSGGAMLLGKLSVPGITVGQGSIVLAIGAGGCCLDIFTLVYHFSPLSPSL